MNKKTVLFLLVFGTLLLGTRNMIAQVAQQDSLALVALYNSTNGSGWTDHSNWLTGPVSTWFGVTVVGGRVTEIDLNRNGLNGTLPAEIGNLTNLTSLFLFRNQLAGAIPTEIGQLTNLDTLSISSNQLSGAIPPEIGNLTNLEFLALNSNQLSGAIPPEIGNLTNLGLLDFGTNQLSGAIPPEIGNLTNLGIMSLSANELSGAIPSEIGNLSSLTVLFLASNQFSGAIPTEIGNLSKLFYLNLVNNQLVDLPNLSGLTSLNTLLISTNQFTFEDIEPNIGVAASFLYAPQDPVGTEEDMSVFLNSPLMVSVSVGGANNQYQWSKDGTKITATASSYTIDSAQPSDAGDYTCEITNTVATDLTLTSRPIHVTVDIAVAEQDSLALVALYNSTDGPNWTDNSNWLNGPVYTWFGVTVSGGRVTEITLDGNNLKGPLPAEIGNLTKLTGLDLVSNQLSGAIPAEIGSLRDLTSLLLTNNRLSGVIPPEIGNLTKLTSLGLGNNQLSGTIPTEIANLMNLPVLVLSNNQLSGAIPPEVGNLIKLIWLDLSTNQLSGTIPAELGNLTKLQILKLSSNQLSGAIPAEIGSLIDLLDLNLAFNQLSGAIPAEIGNLTKLTTLFLRDNQLVDLPDLSDLFKMASLRTLVIPNNRLTFEDIEPNIGVQTFLYAPQDSVGTEENRRVFLNAPLTVSVTVGGDHNQYQWSRNGTQIGGAKESSLTIDSAKLDDAGDYTCDITNTVATDLTLTSRPIHVTVDFGVAEQDSLALVTLYNSTDGPNWDTSDNWLAGPVSTWHGVSVAGGRVTQINLGNNDLTGTIPTQIGNLTNLTRLDLQENQLSDTIPTEIGNLINLTNLLLHENQLSGTVPAEIGNLTELTGLLLEENQLSGAIPSEIVNLIELEFMDLSVNQLVDLPDLSSITSLRTLSIQENRFTFEDIEPNLGIENFTYSDQAPVGMEDTTFVALNAPLKVSVTVGGDNNRYQWSKDGEKITGATSNSYTVDSAKLSDTGDYTCEITNTMATDLTLVSRPIHVTVDLPPVVVTSAAGDLTPTSATLNGTVNPNDLSTTVKFEYGLTTDYGMEIDAVESPVSGSGEMTVRAVLSDLTPNATYHYRVVAANRAASTNGTDQAFTTPLPPYPTQLSVSSTTNFRSLPNATDYATTDYRIVGLPGNSSQSVQTFLTGEQNQDWQVFWDNGAAENFQVVFDGSDTFRFTTGRAFWVINKGPLNIATSVSSAPLSTGQVIEIPLQPGWNLITNPFTIAVSWQSVLQANSTPTPLTDPIWAFTGSFVQSANFEPYTGYYFFNKDNDDRKVLRIPYALYFPGETTAPLTDHTSWEVQIALSSGEHNENASSFGISPETRAGLDAFDFHKPRAVGVLPGVTFQRSEWDARYSHFARDMRPEFAGTEIWTFEARAHDRNATLTFSGIASLPAQHDLYLIRDTSGEFVDLRADSVYRFSPQRDVTAFRVVAGEKNAVQQFLATVVPDEFELGQNYPNPFNPSTRIPVSLPADSEIALKVYDILGREVSTIFSGRIQAGRHVFEWDGRNSVGNRLASGVYFYRLTAGKKASLAGKMILLK